MTNRVAGTPAESEIRDVGWPGNCARRSGRDAAQGEVVGGAGRGELDLDLMAETQGPWSVAGDGGTGRDSFASQNAAARIAPSSVAAKNPRVGSRPVRPCWN